MVQILARRTVRDTRGLCDPACERTAMSGAESEIRSVSDAEVAHLREHGWAKLERLISPQLAGQLLERARVHMGPGGDRHTARHGTDTGNVFWNDRHSVAEDDEAFAAVCFSEQMGANAQRLMRRDVGVLQTANMLAVKIGTKQGSPCASTRPTVFHQDALDLPIDRNGYVSFWIALDHVTRDMGGMRFVDRSQELGMMGLVDLYETYPELEKMTLTAPVELAPGDATVHTMYTIHGTDANETAAPRWALIVAYIPEDAMYTGGFGWSRATLAKRAAVQLETGDRFGGMLRKVL
jgi:ectoine hydroxylase-related dioxygenase (phytanoyl-CoA dioxygenase family)